MFGGYSGSYKSTAASAVAVSALEQGYRVGYASLEMPAEDLVEQMAEIAAGVSRPAEGWVQRFADWADDRLFIYDRLDCIDPMEALQLSICYRAFLGCDLIILDCLMMLGVAEDNEKEKKFVQQLAAIAKSYQCCIVLIHHMKKPMGDEGESKLPNRYSFIGSSHLVNVCASIVIIWANRKKLWLRNAGHPVDDDEDGPDIKINVAKQRNAAWEGVAGLYLHNSARVFCPTKDRKKRAVDIDDKPPLKSFVMEEASDANVVSIA